MQQQRDVGIQRQAYRARPSTGDCHYMDDVFLAFAWQDEEQLEQATTMGKYITARGTGYPPTGTEPET